MAANKDVQLNVNVSSTGIPKVQAQIDNLNKSTTAMGATSNQAKRNMEGVAERANRSVKDFSRMSQGMGGVVAAYATVAAQVYALTAAYSVLKNAANFTRRQSASEDLAVSTGRSFKIIAESMVEATKGAITYRQALESANKIGTVGLDITQIQDLTTLAAKAAQTFGGTTTDAINRFVGAIQKGETELVKQVGIAINLEQAINDYAITMGIAKEDVGATGKQIAIANAILKEGTKVLGGVDIQLSPYEQLAANFENLADKALKLLEPIEDSTAKAALIGLVEYTTQREK